MPTDPEIAAENWLYGELSERDEFDLADPLVRRLMRAFLAGWEAGQNELRDRIS